MPLVTGDDVVVQDTRRIPLAEDTVSHIIGDNIVHNAGLRIPYEANAVFVLSDDTVADEHEGITLALDACKITLMGAVLNG